VAVAVAMQKQELAVALVGVTAVTLVDQQFLVHQVKVTLAHLAALKEQVVVVAVKVPLQQLQVVALDLIGNH